MKNFILSLLLLTSSAAIASTQYVRLPLDAKFVQAESLLASSKAGRPITIKDPFCNHNSSELDERLCEQQKFPSIDTLALTVSYNSNSEGHYVYDGSDQREWTTKIEANLHFSPEILGREKELWDANKKVRLYGKQNKELINRLFAIEDKMIQAPSYIIDEQNSVRCDYDVDGNLIDKSCIPKTVYKKDPTGKMEAKRYLVIRSLN